MRGVTRKSCIELLKSWGVPVEERLLSVDELFDASEEFLAMLMDAAKQPNPTRYYSTTQIIENIASEFRELCKMGEN